MGIINSTEPCTGCNACAAVCSHNAMEMRPDTLGFLTPIVNENICIDCGLCSQICPQNHARTDSSTIVSIVAGLTLDENLLINSSSGGAFSEIVKMVEKDNPDITIYGATYKEGSVCHIRIDQSDELRLLRKSKYTQSKIGDTYIQIKKDLKGGKYVIFVGTPCQVAGLKAYLMHKTYINLLTIDLLCTGVCSPILFENHVKFMQSKNRQTISSYDMRDKQHIEDKWHIMEVSIEYDSQKIKDKDDGLFIGCFRQHVAFRDSCYNCRYTNTNREGDITLGDYWKDINSNVKKDKGLSVIIANNEKAKSFIDRLKGVMTLVEVTAEDIIEQQPALRRPVQKPRFNVAQNINTVMGSVRFMRKYSKPPIKIRCLEFISHHLPAGCANTLKRIYYKLSK